eukprot:TRINITY_DN79381_c0_g1_i1.p1 TRINITY_DN79381_c0_g1~~TRINITY_DN79381_c0_g1_i1.p1  ORF type:complete len:947 (+),score=170.29 TRINITY_DN79381_c0_g1_i1:49-2889(+)
MSVLAFAANARDVSQQSPIIKSGFRPRLSALEKSTFSSDWPPSEAVGPERLSFCGQTSSCVGFIACAALAGRISTSCGRSRQTVETKYSERSFLKASLILIATATACASIDRIYRPVSTALSFRSPINELVFMVFTAGSIFWFLSPSALGAQTHRLLHAFGMKSAAKGCTWKASIGFAASKPAAAMATILQALFAAGLVANAIPAPAKYALPHVPKLSSMLSSNGARDFAGPFLGTLLTLPGWLLQVLAVLIRERGWMLAVAFLGVQGSRFVLAATEPAPRKKPMSVLSACTLEGARTALAGCLVFTSFKYACLATGSAPTGFAFYLVALSSFVFASPLLQDVLARVIGAAKLKNVKQISIRGCVGGESQSASGEFCGFEGRSAKIEYEDGLTGYIRAAAAMAVIRQDRSAGQTSVPAKSIEAALQALQPKKDKKKLLKVVPLALMAGGVLYKFPEAGIVAFGFAMSLYLSKMVVPRVLLLTLAAVTLFSNGPFGSPSSYGIGAGIMLGSLLFAPGKESASPIAVCTSLSSNESKAMATIEWRGMAKAEGQLEADIKAAVAASTSSNGPKSKKFAKTAVSAVLSASLCFICANFEHVLSAIKAATAGQRFHSFIAVAVCAAASIRLMKAGLINTAAREVLPGRLGAICSAPATVVHWLLAVNFRMAALSAAVALVLPGQGLLQRIMYNTGISLQIKWLDAWVLQVSYGFLAAVLIVQAVKLALSALPQRSRQPLAQAANSCVRASLFGSAAALLLQAVLFAAGSPGQPTPGPGSAVTTKIIAGAALAGATPAIITDWLARLYINILGSDQSYWVASVSQTGKAMAVRGELVDFSGRFAVLQLQTSSLDSLNVGAGALLQSGCNDVRYVGGVINVAPANPEEVIHTIYAELGRQGRLIHRSPFTPAVSVSTDGKLKVNAFVDKEVQPDEACRIQSVIMTAAASKLAD